MVLMGLLVIEKSKPKKDGKFIKNSFSGDDSNQNATDTYSLEEQVVFTVPKEKVTSDDEPSVVLPTSNASNTFYDKGNEDAANKASIKIDESNYKNFVSNDTNYEESFKVANDDEKIDFKDEGMEDGILKNEASIFNTCFFTILDGYLSYIITLVIVLVMVYLLVKGLGYNFEIFPARDLYTADLFNSDVKRAMAILAIFTFVAGIIGIITMTISVRRRLKYYYLEKVNVFIYDAFLIFINIFLYVIVCALIFYEIDNLYLNFELLKSNGQLLEAVNIEAIVHFKMFIVIIDSVLLTLASYFCIDINHKKNKFVFLESRF